MIDLGRVGVGRQPLRSTCAGVSESRRNTSHPRRLGRRTAADRGMTAMGLGEGGEELPLVGNSAEGVHSTVGEFQARSRHQVLDCAGHEDLARRGAAHDPRCDVDGDPGDVIAEQFDLTGVEAGIGVGSQLDGVGEDGLGATDRSAGPSNTASTPSPVDFTSPPRWRSIWRLLAWDAPREVPATAGRPAPLPGWLSRQGPCRAPRRRPGLRWRAAR